MLDYKCASIVDTQDNPTIFINDENQTYESFDPDVWSNDYFATLKDNRLVLLAPNVRAIVINKYDEHEDCYTFRAVGTKLGISSDMARRILMSWNPRAYKRIHELQQFVEKHYPAVNAVDFLNSLVVSLELKN